MFPGFFSFWPAFVNLGLGWGLAAASLPIIIHLLSKRRYRELEWAAMQYLLEAVKKSSRRLRLEQFLLLAIRTLLILLVVLAMMQPYWEQTAGAALLAGQRTHKVIVIDGSFSMGYTPDQTSVFDQAKSIAREIVHHGATGDGYTLVLLADPPREIIRQPAFQAADVLREIDRLQLPHGRGNVGATLEVVEKLITKAKTSSPELIGVEIYFLTDLGRATWTGEPIPPQTLDAFAARSAEATVAVVDLGLANAENVAVTELSPLGHYATIVDPVALETQLANYSRQKAARQRVELVVDGQIVSEREVELEPGGTRSLQFTHQFLSPGDHAIEVRTSGDRLEIDNHRWLSLPVQDAVEVLCIGGKSGREAFSAADYLRVALAPGADRGQRTAIRPTIAHEHALLEIPDLNKYDCIFLANVRRFSESEAARLDAYLQQGGGLVFLLGDQIVPDSYNRWLTGDDPRGFPILPARIGAKVEVPEGQKSLFLDPLDYQHELVGIFRGNERAGLTMNPIRKYYRLELLADRQGEAAALVGGGDPFLITARRHAGRVILAASSADNLWGVSPKALVYVPLVHEILKYAVHDRAASRNVVVGAAVNGALVKQPIGLGIATPTEGMDFTLGPTSKSGIFAFDFGPPIAAQGLLAVHVDPRESDLTKLERVALEKDVWPAVRFLYQTQRPDLAAPTAPQILRHGEWHRYLLFAALGLVFLETFLAWKLGYHRP